MELKTYTLQELSEMLNVHVTTLRNCVHDGRLKAIKLGNKYIVSEENYRDFINGRKWGVEHV